jgi:hypothetical protein
VLTVTRRRTLLDAGVNIVTLSKPSLSISHHIHCTHVAVAGALRMAAEVGENDCIRTGWTVAAGAGPGGKTGQDSRHKMVAVDDASCDSIQVSFSNDRQNQIGEAIVRVLLLRGIRLLRGVTRRARVRWVVGHHFSISVSTRLGGKEYSEDAERSIEERTRCGVRKIRNKNRSEIRAPSL